MTTIKREDTATGTITVFTDMNAAVEQFIKDGFMAEFEYMTGLDEIDELGEIEDWLNDMTTVFETRHMIDSLEGEETLEAGAFIYSK